MANEVTIAVEGRDSGARAVLTSGAKAADKLSTSVTRAGEVARGLLAAGLLEDIGRKAQQFLGQAATAATSLEQAVGGTEAVFGDAGTAIDEFARRSAQAVGLSEQEFRDATTLIGGQLKRMTGDVGLAADASVQLVQVGADLAATYGGTTRQAVDAFAAALRGEADPAERFNLNLKVSAVNAKAVELGLAASTSEVDENAKAQALLALVTEQSADAQGQFAREADTAAVAQQKARAEWENAQATLGQTLLPLMANAAGAVSTLATSFGELPGPVQGTVAVVALLGAGLLALVPRIAAAKVAMAELGVSARAANLALGAVGLALVVLTGTMMESRGAQQRVTISASEFASTLNRQSGAITENTRRLVENRLEQEGVLEAAEHLGIAADDLVDAILGEEDALRRVNRALGDRAIVEGENQEKTILSKQLLTDWIGELDKGQAEIRQSTADTEAQTRAQQDEADATRGQIVALEELADTLRAQTEPMFAVIRSQRELRDRQREYTKAVDVFGRNSPKAEEALLNLTEAGFDAASAAADAAGKFDGRLTPSMRAALRAAGLTERQLRDLERELKDAGRQADRTRRDFEQIAGTYNVDFQIRQFGSVPGGRADIFLSEHGGIVGAVGAGDGVRPMQGGGQSGAATGLVGEAGPELVEFPFGTRVIPAGQTRAVLREAREALAAARSGRLFEDFSFRGGGREQFNDLFADWFFGGGGRFKRREVTRFLEGVVEGLDRPREPARSAGFGDPDRFNNQARGDQMLVLHVSFDESRFGRLLSEALQFELRTDTGLRDTVSVMVRR